MVACALGVSLDLAGTCFSQAFVARSVKMVRATLTEINESVSTLCWNGSCKRHDTVRSLCC